MEIEVRGHSGCQIDVVNEDGGIYVYKSTADPKYLQRLALQAKKQMAAAGVEYQHIRVPKVYELQGECRHHHHQDAVCLFQELHRVL